MSPTLLAQRLRELEAAGIVERRALRNEKGIFEYHLTESGRDLRQVVEAMGFWGQKWVEARQSLKNLDPSLLMWDMRRNLEPSPLPHRRMVIQFLYPGTAAVQALLVAGGRAAWRGRSVLVGPRLRRRSLRLHRPQHDDVDLDGRDHRCAEAGKFTFTGDRKIADTMQIWLGLSPFAVEPKRTAA